MLTPPYESSFWVPVSTLMKRKLNFATAHSPSLSTLLAVRPHPRRPTGAGKTLPFLALPLLDDGITVIITPLNVITSQTNKLLQNAGVGWIELHGKSINNDERSVSQYSSRAFDGIYLRSFSCPLNVFSAFCEVVAAEQHHLKIFLNTSQYLRKIPTQVFSLSFDAIRTSTFENYRKE